MNKKKYIEVKLCREFIAKATTKNPIWAIELYITNRLNLVWLKAKKVPKKVESTPKKSNISLTSKKNKCIEEIILIKKQKMAILGMIEKIIVALNGAPS